MLGACRAMQVCAWGPWRAEGVQGCVCACSVVCIAGRAGDGVCIAGHAGDGA